MKVTFIVRSAKCRIRNVSSRPRLGINTFMHTMRDLIRLVETIDDDTLMKYQHGRCMYLALALHDLAGWPIYAEVSTDGRIIHAWANHGGRAVDINGVHPTNFAEAEGPDKRGDKPTEVKSLNADQLRAKYVGDMPQVLDQTKELILANKSHFGL